MSKTVLLFSNDLPPLPGQSVTGGGLRVRGLAEGLRSRGHEVVISVPASRLDALSTRTAKPLRSTAFAPERLNAVVRDVEPDVVVMEQWALASYFDDSSAPLVIDLHGSLILENHYRGHRALKYNAAAKIKALSKADFVLCASELQRHYFTAWLLLSGFSPDQPRIASIPVLLEPAEMPSGVSKDSHSIIFGGIAWPWVDPFPGLEILARELQDHPSYKLKIYSGLPDLGRVLPHDQTIATSPLVARYQSLVSKNVAVHGLISHARFLQRAKNACLAFDVFQRNPERELAFVTRTAEYLACGLPVIHGDYDEIGKWIEQAEAGWVVDPSNPDQVLQAVRAALDDREELARRAENALRLVRKRLFWNRGIEPLHRFCMEPRQREPQEPVFREICLDINRLEEEAAAALEKHRHVILEHERTTSHLNAEIYQLKEGIGGRDQTIFQLRQDAIKARATHDDAFHQLQMLSDSRLRDRDERIREREERIREQGERIQEQEERIRSQEERIRSAEARAEEGLALTEELQDRDRCIREQEDRIRAAEKRSEEALIQVEKERDRTSEALASSQQAEDDLVAAEKERASVDRENIALQRRLERSEATSRRLGLLVEDLEQSAALKLERGGRRVVDLSTDKLPVLARAILKSLNTNLYLRYKQRLSGKQVFPGQ